MVWVGATPGIMSSSNSDSKNLCIYKEEHPKSKVHGNKNYFGPQKYVVLHGKSIT